MNSYLRILPLLTLCWLTACRPSYVLSPSEMEVLLYDLHRADAILAENGYMYGRDEEQQAYYFVVLANHGITQEQFDSTLVWYTHHPERFDKIYPRVVERLDHDLLALQEMQGIARKNYQYRLPLDQLMNEYRNGWKPDYQFRKPPYRDYVLKM